MPFEERFRDTLAAPLRPMRTTNRTALAAVLALAAALHLPALGAAFYVDDYTLQLALEGRLALRRWSLFDFGELSEWRKLDAFPFWTDPDWKVRFLRPVASLVAWVDHALFGRFVLGHHASGLAYWVLALFAVHRAYRVLGLGAKPAVVALALLASSTSTAIPVGWPANRSDVLVLGFTALALAAAARVARGGSTRAALCALALAAGAALSKESGVATYALVAATGILAPAASERERAAGRRRARAMAAAALGLALAHAGFYVAAGYGTHSLFYATPWHEPARWLAGAARLVPVGVLSLVSPVVSDAWIVAPRVLPVLVAAGALALLVLAVWMSRRLAGSRVAALLALWTALALAAQAGAPLSDRLLLLSAAGAAGLVALHVTRVLGSESPRAERIAAFALALSMGPLSALATFAVSASLADQSHALRRAALEADVGDPALGHREVVILQAENALGPFGIAQTRAFEVPHDTALSIRILQVGRRGLSIERTAERTLEVETLGAPFLTHLFETVYRTGPAPAPVGKRWPGRLFDVEVLAATDEGPTRLRLDFHRSLDDDRVRLLAPEGGRLSRVLPPPVGETLRLEPVPPPRRFAP